jgi:proteasome accessory factor C
MSRLAASDRLQRLLSIVPWIVDHPGAPVEEVCTRFGIGERELLDALEMLRFVGVYPFSPDALIDVVLEDGKVWLHLAQPFGRPLRLTPEEGLALVAAGRSMVGAPGADPNGSLSRGLAKLARSLGITDDAAVDVQLADEVAPELLERIRLATRERRRLAIDYYSFARDDHTSREIDPYRVYADQGRWYVSAWCHRADGERIFRVDRIQSAEVLDVTFDEPDGGLEGAEGGRGTDNFHPGPDAPQVVLELGPDAAWVADHYPHESIEDQGEGRFRITLVVTARPWLERLLLSLGPDAGVVALDERLGRGDVRAQAAARLLVRYGIEVPVQ